jgi:alkanesulfonate monooxygenase SsuD/methylene tetrahydromethanopterin reductase-like flavin-dependent oxidoreductase (luciferase family)
MELGLFSLLPLRDVSQPIKGVYDETVSLVRMAEAIGFDIAWFAEHHFGNYCMCPSPLLMATHCAAHTSTIRLGTGVLVLPLYHPMRVVQEIGMVDTLSDGRLVVGIGSGYQAYEFDRFAVPLEEAWTMTHEFLDILEMGLDEGRVGYQGKYYQVPETALGVRPLQQPAPPIYVTGNEPKYLQRAARRGYVPFASAGAQPVTALLKIKEHVASNFAEAGHDPDSMPFAVQRFIYVTDDRTEALDAAERALYTGRIAMSLRGRYEKVDGCEIVPQAYDHEPSPEEIVANVIIGDAETCAEKLVEELRTVRPSHLSAFMHFGGLDFHRAMRSLERFGAEVLPAVDRALGGLDRFGPPASQAAAQYPMSNSGDQTFKTGNHRR